MSCPCENKRSYKWHYDNKISVCEPSRRVKNAERRWVPGTDIIVEEIEEL